MQLERTWYITVEYNLYHGERGGKRLGRNRQRERTQAYVRICGRYSELCSRCSSKESDINKVPPLRIPFLRMDRVPSIKLVYHEPQGQEHGTRDIIEINK